MRPFSGCPGSGSCSAATRWRTRSPTSTSRRLSELTSPTSKRLRRLEADRILPNHGDPETIASGGYTADLITATEHYIRALRASREQPELRQVSLREFVAEPLEAGWVHYFAPYEAVHRGNIKTVLAR